MVQKKTSAPSFVEREIRKFKESLRLELLDLLSDTAAFAHPVPALDIYGNTLDNMDERQLANIVAVYRRRQIQHDRSAMRREHIEDWFACRCEDIATFFKWLKISRRK